jgi:hypothetical protein
MVTYTIRKGSKDEEEERTVNNNGSLSADTAGYQTARQQFVAGKYRSKTKLLVQASGFVTDDALADGTATLGQRMMVRGIKLLFTCMWLIMVAFGLWVLTENILGIYLIIGPTVWFSMVVWNWHKDYRAAVRRVANRRA